MHNYSIRVPQPFPAPEEVLNYVDVIYRKQSTSHTTPTYVEAAGTLFVTGHRLNRVTKVFPITRFVGWADREQRDAMGRSDRVRQIERIGDVAAQARYHGSVYLPEYSLGIRLTEASQPDLFSLV